MLFSRSALLHRYSFQRRSTKSSSGSWLSSKSLTRCIERSHVVLRRCPTVSQTEMIESWPWLTALNVVARDGIEPPTPAFSGPRSTTELSGLGVCCALCSAKSGQARAIAARRVVATFPGGEQPDGSVPETEAADRGCRAEYSNGTRNRPNARATLSFEAIGLRIA